MAACAVKENICRIEMEQDPWVRAEGKERDAALAVREASRASFPVLESAPVLVQAKVLAAATDRPGIAARAVAKRAARGPGIAGDRPDQQRVGNCERHA
jgi:hypothetical protein